MSVCGSANRIRKFIHKQNLFVVCGPTNPIQQAHIPLNKICEMHKKQLSGGRGWQTAQISFKSLFSAMNCFKSSWTIIK